MVKNDQNLRQKGKVKIGAEVVQRVLKLVDYLIYLKDVLDALLVPNWRFWQPPKTGVRPQVIGAEFFVDLKFVAFGIFARF